MTDEFVVRYTALDVQQLTVPLYSIYAEQRNRKQLNINRGIVDNKRICYVSK